MPRKTNCTLKFEPITVDTVSRIIGGLKPKTSTGVDRISNKLVKFGKNVISEPLSIIISQMLKYLKLSLYIKKMMTEIYQIIGLFHCYLLYKKYLRKLYLSSFLLIWIYINDLPNASKVFNI